MQHPEDHFPRSPLCAGLERRILLVLYDGDRLCEHADFMCSRPTLVVLMCLP